MKKWTSPFLIRLNLALMVAALSLQNPALAQMSKKAKSQNSKTENSQQAKSPQSMSLFVDNLLSRMSLAEKLGQLNLLSVGVDITGPVLNKDCQEKISAGLVGGVFNIYGPQAVRKLQETAVTKSRLKIPMLFGYDVIHGHRTIFPIPLALASSWDMALVEKTASAAAAEASADGLNWTFSPMVDISRDPRWGRVSEGAGEDPYLGAQIASSVTFASSPTPWAIISLMAV